MKLAKPRLMLVVALLGATAWGSAIARDRHGGGDHGGGRHFSGGHFGGGHGAGSHFSGGHFGGGHGGGFHYYFAPYAYSPYFYYPPAYPASESPPVYIEQNPASAAPAQQSSYWYYCRSSKTYYPYVKECPDGWQQVAPQPPPPS